MLYGLIYSLYKILCLYESWGLAWSSGFLSQSLHCWYIPSIWLASIWPLIFVTSPSFPQTVHILDLYFLPVDANLCSPDFIRASIFSSSSWSCFSARICFSLPGSLTVLCLGSEVLLNTFEMKNGSEAFVGPQITWPDPGLSLVLPPSLLLETWKLGDLETW